MVGSDIMDTAGRKTTTRRKGTGNCKAFCVSECILTKNCKLLACVCNFKLKLSAFRKFLRISNFIIFYYYKHYLLSKRILAITQKMTN